jgi:hypothetical protein
MSTQQVEMATTAATVRRLTVSQQQMAEVIGKLLAHEWTQQQSRDRNSSDRSTGLANSDLIDAKPDADGR